jgi:hypothetical protein
MMRRLLAWFEERVRCRDGAWLADVTASVMCHPVDGAVGFFSYEDYSYCRCPSHTARPRAGE